MKVRIADIIQEILDIDKQLMYLQEKKAELQEELDWYKEKEIEAQVRYDGSDFIGE